MNRIIEELSSHEVMRNNVRNEIIGGIGTIEGKIWIAFRNKRVVKKPIISSDSDIVVQQPIEALTHLERGPSGSHDIIITSGATLELLYCHQSISTLRAGSNVCLFGRTYLINTLIDSDSDSGDDESDEYELKTGEHLRLISGHIMVRVSATGHRIHVKSEDMTKTNVEYQTFFYELD